MATRRIKINLSCTEFSTFRRLVTLLEQVECHADEQCDVALKELVNDAREDLLRLREEG